jgi:acyl-coenzyme A synthetase/AMP-(fatty) acid ligase
VLKAGVDVRIVDDDGSDVSPGRPGIVAVRTPAMVEAYIGQPDASRDAFREGWFLSGDWGALVAPRVLRLMGRCDDLVNAGGVKVPAALLEAQVRELVEPRDCAVLSVNLDGGRTTLGIALVAADDAQREVSRRKLAEGLSIGSTVGAKVIFLPHLPCLRTGKVDRARLHELFASPPAGSI